MRFSRRQRFALIATGVLLFYALLPVGLVYGEDFIAGVFNTAGEGGHFNATQGPDVTLGQDFEVQAGNPATLHSINLSTGNNGWVNLSSTSGDPNVTVQTIEGQTTQLTELDVSNTDLTINPSDKQEVTIGGPLTTFNFSAMTLNDGNVDFTYNGTGGDATVTVTELPANREIEAVDADTGDVLDTATSDQDGTVTFDSLPTSKHDVELNGRRAVITEPERPSMPFASFLWLGGVAVLATLGVFTRIDTASRLVVTVLAALLWAVWGLSAMDVQTTVTKFGTQSEAITPLVYLGLGLAFVGLLYAAWQVYELLSSEAADTEPEMLLR